MQDGVLTKLSPLPGMSLDLRERVTHELLEVEPVLDDCEPVMEKVVQKIAALTGKSVGLVSTGPTAEHVSLLEELPA
jgi:hypothetical protein